MRTILLFALSSAAACVSPAIADDCPRDARLVEEHQFAIEDDERRQVLAIDLLGCLGSVDPKLRDDIAFTALSKWMRSGELSSQTATTIVERLLPRIAPAHPDPDGVLRPFAALVLSEVARMDRLNEFLSARQRASLIDAGTTFLRTVADYRGFEEGIGWRHAVAHGADLLLQLGLKPTTSKADLDRILDAIAEQVAPSGEHAYIHGEPERLARAVFFIAQRKLHSAQEWQQWLDRVSAAAPLSSWGDAYRSRAGLAKRHNTMAFLQAIYLYVRLNGNDIQDRLESPIVQSIERLS